MTVFNISIISDTVCPWCYVGWKRLSAAIVQHSAANPTDSFAVSWLPFQLNPHAPRGPGAAVDKTAYYHAKFGAAQARAVFARLAQAGAEAGIKFSFGGKTGNTLDSHRLIALAAAKEPTTGLQTRLVTELFRDYFEREQDITDHGVLARAAGRAGLDETEVKRFLAGDQLASETERDAGAARAEGVHGVPHFTINGMYEVEGGQEPAAFLRLFQRYKQREASA